MLELFRDLLGYEGDYHKTKHLGYFIDELEAHNAYQTALKTI